DGAQISGSGSYVVDAKGIPHLDLTIAGSDVAVDQTLYQALPESCQTIYRELSPTGITAFKTRIAWTPGSIPKVKLAARISQGSFAVKSFPFALDQVQAELLVGEGEITVKSLSGKHDETHVQFSAKGSYVPGEEWRLRLENLLVEDLEADRRFRKTLPARLR